MKSIIPIIATLAVPVLICQTVAQDVPPALMDFQAGKYLAGESVIPEPTPEFTRMQNAVSAKLQALPEDKRNAFFSTYRADTLMAYSPDFWNNWEEYDRYRAEWKKIGLKQLQKARLRAVPFSKNIWKLHGDSTNPETGKRAMLSVISLEYHADKNVWISGNGELKPTEITTLNDNLYGARKGTSWTLSKEDALSQINESLTITRRMNGEFLYLTYNFSEKIPGSGTVLAQGSYVLRFRVGEAAPDPAEAIAPEPERPKASEKKPEIKKDEPRKKKRKKRRRRKKHND